MDDRQATPQHIVRQQIAKRRLLHDRMADALTVYKQAVEALERFRTETKELYAERWEEAE